MRRNNKGLTRGPALIDSSESGNPVSVPHVRWCTSWWLDPAAAELSLTESLSESPNICYPVNSGFVVRLQRFFSWYSLVLLIPQRNCLITVIIIISLILIQTGGHRSVRVGGKAAEKISCNDNRIRREDPEDKRCSFNMVLLCKINESVLLKSMWQWNEWSSGGGGDRELDRRGGCGSLGWMTHLIGREAGVPSGIPLLVYGRLFVFTRGMIIGFSFVNLL